jgi:2-polyprenyl-3-methyl-5-hydroxy-6-metoxy-1,4-benzoquinol methylase
MAQEPEPETERWEHEAAFFDRVMGEQHEEVKPVDPLALDRYGSLVPRRWFKEEFRFHVLQNLHGKRLLDVGCGDGRNSVLLAILGAQVTGIDISPRSIELAKKKAEVNRVQNVTKFICAPIEKAVIPPGSFDVIWGDAFLHHVINNLDTVLSRLMLWAAPGALMMFSEPVNFNNTLRRLRFKLPIVTEATPDERPLEPTEIEIVRRFLPDLQIRFYAFLNRLERYVLLNHNYERSSALRRAVANALALFDYGWLSLPILKNMGGCAVFYGHTPRGRFAVAK